MRGADINKVKDIGKRIWLRMSADSEVGAHDESPRVQKTSDGHEAPRPYCSAYAPVFYGKESSGHRKLCARRVL